MLAREPKTGGITDAESINVIAMITLAILIIFMAFPYNQAVKAYHINA
jgi:hypothetical protein